MTTVVRRIDSPLGVITLVGRGGALCGVYLPDQHNAPSLAGVEERPGALGAAAGQMEEWFEGRRREFSLELAAEGTPFQRQVWEALREVPFGTTTTYGLLAQRIGRPGSGRAVGSAVGRNPLSIVVPCHRVVGAAGALTGYAGGLDAKRSLLDHERGVLAGQSV